MIHEQTEAELSSTSSGEDHDRSRTRVRTQLPEVEERPARPAPKAASAKAAPASPTAPPPPPRATTGQKRSETSTILPSRREAAKDIFSIIISSDISDSSADDHY
eukprot:7938639-Pyramimonas_sp.AAC.1